MVVFLDGLRMINSLIGSMLNSILSFVYVYGLCYLCCHERRQIKQTYYSGKSQIEIGQFPTEKTDGGKGYYA